MPTTAPVDIVPLVFCLSDIVGSVEAAVMIGVECEAVARSVALQFIWTIGANAVTDSIFVVLVIVAGSCPVELEVVVRTETYGNGCMNRIIVSSGRHDPIANVVEVVTREQLAPEVAELKHVYPLHSHCGILLALECLSEFDIGGQRDAYEVWNYLGQHPTAVSPSSIVNWTGHWAPPLAVAVHALL